MEKLLLGALGRACAVSQKGAGVDAGLAAGSELGICIKSTKVYNAWSAKRKAS